MEVLTLILVFCVNLQIWTFLQVNCLHLHQNTERRIPMCIYFEVKALHNSAWLAYFLLFISNRDSIAFAQWSFFFPLLILPFMIMIWCVVSKDFNYFCRILFSQFNSHALIYLWSSLLYSFFSKIPHFTCIFFVFAFPFRYCLCFAFPFHFPLERGGSP